MSRFATVSAVACLGLPVLIVLMTLTAPSGDGGTWSRLIVEVQQAQNALHRELAATLQAVQEDGATAAAWLITLSFVYGVLHAVGPGHGKVVITTYLMTQRSRLARGIQHGRGPPVPAMPAAHGPLRVRISTTHAKRRWHCTDSP